MKKCRNHSGKIFNDWKIIEPDGWHEFKVNPTFDGRGFRRDRTYSCQCLRCGKIWANRRLNSIIQGKSTKCQDCSRRDMHAKAWIVNKTKVGSKNFRWRGTQNIPKTYFSHIRYMAKTRGHTFDLTIEDLQKQWDFQQGRCFYTGTPLEFRRHKESSTWKNSEPHASLDRIDSQKGYAVGNIVWATKSVNFLKSDFPQEIFLGLIKKIQEHLKL